MVLSDQWVETTEDESLHDIKEEETKECTEM
jgi:hypothetical protein